MGSIPLLYREEVKMPDRDEEKYTIMLQTTMAGWISFVHKERNARYQIERRDFRRGRIRTVLGAHLHN